MIRQARHRRRRRAQLPPTLRARIEASRASIEMYGLGPVVSLSREALPILRRVHGVPTTRLEKED